MIIVVSTLLFWQAIFLSEDRTNDEYTWITRRFRVKSITFDPLKEAGRMTVRPFNPMVSRIFGALVKSMDRIWGLDPDVPVTQSLDGYRECGVSHGVGHGDDFSDRVETRRDRYFLVIGIRDHIVRIHVVEHGLIGSDQDSDGSDGWVPILVRVDPFESTIGKQTLDEHKVMHFPLITKRYIRAKKGERWFWRRQCPHSKVFRALFLIKAKNTSRPLPNCVAHTIHQLTSV